MHITARHKIQEVIIKKLGELHIITRNWKTHKLAEGQFIDYVVIHDVKRDISPYHPDACTPTKIDRDPPCGEAVTIVDNHVADTMRCTLLVIVTTIY
jgi:hypothetical protein